VCRSKIPALWLVLLELLCLAHTSSAAHAEPARVALVNTAPALLELAACITQGLISRGPVLDSTALVEGLEFRMTLRGADSAHMVLAVTGLMKPDVSALVASHDDDPEAHPQAAARVYGMLRVHIGTRAWVWSPERQNDICGEVAQWIDALRTRPILFDRLGPDGEPR